jgi:hypothetical protein
VLGWRLLALLVGRRLGISSCSLIGDLVLVGRARLLALLVGRRLGISSCSPIGDLVLVGRARLVTLLVGWGSRRARQLGISCSSVVLGCSPLRPAVDWGSRARLLAQSPFSAWPQLVLALLGLWLPRHSLVHRAAYHSPHVDDVVSGAPALKGSSLLSTHLLSLAYQNLEDTCCRLSTVVS